MKILLIDEDRMRGEQLQFILEHLYKWKIFRAESPSDGIRLLKRQSKEIDIILLDIMMPADEAVDVNDSNLGMDTGLLVLEKIRKELKLEIPIMLYTARRDLGYLKDENLISDYAVKPISIEELSQKIKDVCSNKHNSSHNLND